MSDERDLSNEERKLEAALSRFKPREPKLDAASIAFEAGRRSAGWSLSAWRAAAAILFVAIVVAGLLRPAPRTIEKLVLVQPPAVVTVARVSYAPVQPPVRP